MLKLIIGIVLVIAIIGVVIGARAHKTTPSATPKAVSVPGAIKYLPLGDSYTIGQSVSAADRWPNQLVERLKADGKQLQIVDNPSVTGYTTQNLIDRELPLVARDKPDFVTILIGVNDYVQGVDPTTFQQRLQYIVQQVQRQLHQPRNVLLVTIPDYGKTPTGAQFGNPEVSEAGIMQFNKIITQVAAQYNLPVADVFPVSQQVANDPSLIANDGLHPSGKEYNAWTDIIYKTMQANALPR